MQVKVLKPHQGPHGFVQAGATIEVDAPRYRALARSGIVAAPQGEEQPLPAGVKHAITNQDFRPRREKLTLTKADQAATGGTAKGK